MMKIFLYNFNNYYQRQVKRRNRLVDYGDYVYAQDNHNFDYNDGVNTTIIVGQQSSPYYGGCDYLIVTDMEYNILHRWFIVEEDKNAYGQYKVSLKRDSIADFYSEVLGAECKIQRCILPQDSIYNLNPENITVNQIKRGETLIKDETGVGWICGYLDRGEGSSDSSVDIRFESQYVQDITTANIQLENYYANRNVTPTFYYYTGQRIFAPAGKNKVRFIVCIREGSTSVNYRKYYVWLDSSNQTIEVITGELEAYSSGVVPYVKATLPSPSQYSANEYIRREIASYIDWEDFSYENNTANIPFYQARYNASIKQFYEDNNQKIIYDQASQAYYRVELKKPTGFGETLASSTINNFTKTAIQTALQSPIFSNLSEAYLNDFNSIVSEVVLSGATVSLDLCIGEKQKVMIPSTANRLHLKDAPWDMFCIPYGAVEVEDSSNEILFSFNEETAISQAQAIAKGLGSKLFDMQLLPYCPMTGVCNNGYIDASKFDSTRYTYIYKDSSGDPEQTGIILWSTASNGTKNINIRSLGYKDKNGVSKQVIEPGDLKIGTVCDFIRLVSPDGMSTFEFKPSFNIDTIQDINVDYTYLPGQPYVHLYPVFSDRGIYGADYDDYRGLIGGSYSIAYLRNNWIEFQLQNKNYQNIFDREIASADYQHEWQKAENIIGIGTSALQGAAAGSLAGPWGAAVAGAAVGAGAGVVDLVKDNAIYNEQKDAKMDIHNMQLGNVKAQPQSIARSTSYNRNNKIFPYIEVWSCSQEELKQIALFIRHNSMTAGIIGKIQDYYYIDWSCDVGDEIITDRGFVQATPIRYQDLAEDYHLAMDIARELQLGVYLK